MARIAKEFWMRFRENHAHSAIVSAEWSSGFIFCFLDTYW